MSDKTISPSRSSRLSLSREQELQMQSVFISQGRLTRISEEQTRRAIETEIEKIKNSQIRLPI